MPDLHDPTSRPEPSGLTARTSEAAERIGGFARDAAYVVVGLGVLGVQRAQVERVQLQKRLAGEPDLRARFEEARSAWAAGVEQVDGLLEQVDGLLEEAGRFVEGTLQPVGEQLPASVRELAQRAQDHARELVSLVTSR